MKTKTKFPPLCIAIYALTLLSIGLYVAFRLSPDFADAFNSSVSQFLRHALAAVTSRLPFSIAEWFLLSLPVFAIALIWLGIRAAKKSNRNFWFYLATILSIVCLVFCSFVWTFAAGYSTHGIDQKLGLKRTKVSEVDLLRTAITLTNEVNELSGGVITKTNGATVMPYSFDTLCDRLLTAYEDFAAETGALTTFYSSPKPVLTSELLSYAHITGVYAFPTGEANINIDFPDYTVPFTMAHELAHQRGIAREDEANFVAYLVCMKSDDSYIKYSGAINLWEYVMNAMYETNTEYYSLLLKVLGEIPSGEEAAYTEFYKKYADNSLATVNDFMNDTYLKSQGAEAGSRSYDLVVDLAVAHFKNIGRIPQS